jgi:hypothetical protein
MKRSLLATRRGTVKIMYTLNDSYDLPAEKKIYNPSKEELIDNGDQDPTTTNDANMEFEDIKCASLDNAVHDHTSSLMIYKHTDSIRRILPEFNILKEIERFEANKQIELHFEDEDDLLHPNLKTTKKLFASALNEFFEQSNTFEKYRTLLLNILHNAFGELIKLPITQRIISETEIDENACPGPSIHALLQENVRCDYKRYCSDQSRFFSFDQCENDCIIYLGRHRDLWRCPSCKRPRFRRCTERKCKTRGSHNCKHLFQTNGKPFKQLHYRPIIIMIFDLLEHSKFHFYLNYVNVHGNATDYYSDFMDGEIAKAHLKEMNYLGLA